jgi:hypothetical protein
MKPTCWLEDCHVRVFPTRNEVGRGPLRVDAARGERISFQACVAAPEGGDPVPIAVRVASPDGVAARVRRVGFVPMAHHNTQTPSAELDGLGHVPGFVPDPLFDESSAAVPPGETVAFWVDLLVERGFPAGAAPVEVSVERKEDGDDGREHGKTRARPVLIAKMRVDLRVWDVTMPPRGDFPVFQWFYADALLDYYGLEPFENGFWDILDPYVRDLVSHGQDTIYVPFLTPPLDGVKRPTQLLRVARSGGRYRFDWRDVKRYVALAGSRGIRRFEWTHFFTQWGVRHAVRVYEGQGIGEKPLWKPETGATSPTYAGFLSQLLPELKRFLESEGIAERSFFHVSDEPHGEEALANYRKARGLLARLAPWIRTMDALSEVVYGREGITDMPIPSISVTRKFVEEGIPCFTYFCCGPRGPYLNRLLDTPLPKIRMAGWLFHRFGVKGFLHWGYNYWYRSQTRCMIDPFVESSGCRWPSWAYGDPFLVYPGEKGPIDSIRWEIFSQSLSDYALLKTLGVERDGPELAGFRDFNDFPKDLAWWKAMRRKLLSDGSRRA